MTSLLTDMRLYLSSPSSLMPVTVSGLVRIAHTGGGRIEDVHPATCLDHHFIGLYYMIALGYSVSSGNAGPFSYFNNIPTYHVTKNCLF